MVLSFTIGINVIPAIQAAETIDELAIIEKGIADQCKGRWIGSGLYSIQPDMRMKELMKSK